MLYDLDLKDIGFPSLSPVVGSNTRLRDLYGISTRSAEVEPKGKIDGLLDLLVWCNNDAKAAVSSAWFFPPAIERAQCILAITTDNNSRLPWPASAASGRQEAIGTIHDGDVHANGRTNGENDGR